MGLSTSTRTRGGSLAFVENRIDERRAAGEWFSGQALNLHDHLLTDSQMRQVGLVGVDLNPNPRKIGDTKQGCPGGNVLAFIDESVEDRSRERGSDLDVRGGLTVSDHVLDLPLRHTEKAQALLARAEGLPGQVCRFV